MELPSVKNIMDCSIKSPIIIIFFFFFRSGKNWENCYKEL